MTSTELIERLRQAVDAHDLDALVDCFDADFHNETPVHPGRGFDGDHQVRANWERIFAGIPDISATVLRTAVDGDLVWSEWEMGGTRPDGAPQLLRGVIIWGVDDDRFVSSRFYLEPVDAGEGGVAAAIGKMVEAEG
jgi:ketosteroid isomerase-like protein